MNKIFENSINFLLENASASIRYLVQRDLLKTPKDAPAMLALQEEILSQDNVKKVLALQCDDGWFGHELHGNDGMDGLLGSLLNAGVEKENPAVQKAIHALVTPEIASQHKNWFHGGEALDAGGRGGNNAITAQILSWVKYPEDYPVIAEQITLSFEHLSSVLCYHSVDDFSISGKNQRYYKPNAKFPGANHISLLAATQSWRTEENLKTAKNAAKHGYELMRNVNEFITFKKPSEYGGGFVGPFNYNWQALAPITKEKLQAIINDRYPFQFAFWLGSVSGVPDFMLQSTGTYEVLSELLENEKIEDLLPEKAFHAFRQVMGKEPSMRKKSAKKCDLTYAILRACFDVMA